METKVKEWKLYLDEDVAKYLFALSLGVWSLSPDLRVPACFAVYFFILFITYRKGKFLRDLNKLKSAKHNCLEKIRFKRLTKPLRLKSLVFSVSPFLFSILFFTFVYSTGL
ncbi:MAG: hypothetical protein ACSHW0_17095 [Thalassotalea sp.]